MTEGTHSHEFDEVPVDKQEVESSGVSDEDRLAIERLDPCDVPCHRTLGRLQSLAACCPGFRLRGPPFSCLRMRLRTRQRFQIGGERGHEDFVRGVCRRANAEHGMWTGNWAIGLDVSADVDLVHMKKARPTFTPFTNNSPIAWFPKRISVRGDVDGRPRVSRIRSG